MTITYDVTWGSAAPFVGAVLECRSSRPPHHPTGNYRLITSVRTVKPRHGRRAGFTRYSLTLEPVDGPDGAPVLPLYWNRRKRRRL